MLNVLSKLNSGAVISKIIMFVIIIAACVGYFYYSQNKINDLNKNIEKYRISAQVAEKTINVLNENADKQQKLMSDLQKDLKQSEADNDKLRKLLREHDLTKLSIKKPGMIEKRINDATKKVFKDIVNISNN